MTFSIPIPKFINPFTYLRPNPELADAIASQSQVIAEFQSALNNRER